MVFETSADFSELLYVNRAYQEIFGRSRESLYAKPRSLLDAVHPEDRAAVEKALDEALGTGRLNEEYRVVRADGSVRWVLNRVTAVREDSGRIARLVGTVQDVTGRKRAEEGLRQSEARNRALLSAIPDLIFMLSRDGVLLDCHAPDPRLLLVPPEVAVGQALHQVLPPPLLRSVRRALDLALLSGEAQGIEHELSLGNERREFEGRVVACDSDKVLVITRDVTERKHAEEALRQAQKLESLEALAGGIAHDFNNILSAILGQASLGLGRLSPDSPVRPHLVKVIDAAERAADIARKMLDYSGHGSLHPRQSDLSQVVEESRSLLEAALPKSLVLRWELAPGLPRVQVDTGQVQHALANLALNAAEAIGEAPGLLTIRTSQRRIGRDDTWFWRHTAGPLPPGPYVALEIEDDGPGMAPAVQAHLFEPFFTTKVAGRGLGLAVVLGIVRGHQGGIAVESRAGATRFELVFPVAGAAAPSRPRRSGRPGRGVLVVDDEAIVRDAVAAILTAEGIPVWSAESAQGAAEVLKDQASDIGMVVLDYSMPALSGTQAYALLREIAPGIPVVLSSGFTEEEALRRFAGLDLAGFLQKPYHPSELLAQVRRVVPQAQPS